MLSYVIRSFLNMFYEEEEREADRIRFKYAVMRERIAQRIRELQSS
jgi:Novel Ras effector 1 C-terminal SARAH (Sav/Rassf/Hpo) domain